MFSSILTSLKHTIKLRPFQLIVFTWIQSGAMYGAIHAGQTCRKDKIIKGHVSKSGYPPRFVNYLQGGILGATLATLTVPAIPIVVTSSLGLTVFIFTISPGIMIGTVFERSI